MNKKINIAFVGDVSSSFVERDYEILKKYFVVRVIQPPNKRPKPKAAAPIIFLR